MISVAVAVVVIALILALVLLFAVCITLPETRSGKQSQANRDTQQHSKTPSRHIPSLSVILLSGGHDCKQLAGVQLITFYHAYPLHFPHHFRL